MILFLKIIAKKGPAEPPKTPQGQFRFLCLVGVGRGKWPATNSLCRPIPNGNAWIFQPRPLDLDQHPRINFWSNPELLLPNEIWALDNEPPGKSGFDLGGGLPVHC